MSCVWAVCNTHGAGQSVESAGAGAEGGTPAIDQGASWSASDPEDESWEGEIGPSPKYPFLQILHLLGDFGDVPNPAGRNSEHQTPASMVNPLRLWLRVELKMVMGEP